MDYPTSRVPIDESYVDFAQRQLGDAPFQTTKSNATVDPSMGILRP